jgi:arsenate reductase
MAEGWLRTAGRGRFDVLSAGSHPSGKVHPQAIAAMAELGIDLSGHTSKTINQFVEHSFDYILTVCDQAAEACPYFPGGGQRLHRNFYDPAAAPPENQPAVFRQVRDQIIQWLNETFNLQDTLDSKKT